MIDPENLRKLDVRLGSKYARQRLKLEADHQAQVFGQGLTFFHLENWYSAASIIRKALKLSGLYWRARRNADRIVIRRNDVAFHNLPSSFTNFTILHISDLHADMSEGAMKHLVEIVGTLRYDICVLTGDYRGKTYGSFEAAMDGVAKMRAQIRGPTYAVLGNHDSIQMVPILEAMDIRVLLNECQTLTRGDQRIHIAGIDDAHFYRAGDDWGRLVGRLRRHSDLSRTRARDASGEGTTGVDDAYATAYFAGIGAEIMGAGMFGLHAHPDDPDWRGWWGDEPPFHCRCSCSPTGPSPLLEMAGGTTFHFLDCDPHARPSTVRGQAAGGQGRAHRRRSDRGPRVPRGRADRPAPRRHRPDPAGPRHPAMGRPAWPRVGLPGDRGGRAERHRARHVRARSRVNHGRHPGRLS